MNKFLPLAFLIITFISCQPKYPGIPEKYNALLDSAFVMAGDNSSELQKALAETPASQKEGMAFLISYMPKRDLSRLSSDFLLENVELAYKAREKYPWCASLPDSIFLNEVLPYANVSEDRDRWRPEFYERFAKYVDDKDNMVDAIMAIAKNIEKEVNVEYNTKRSRVDISPLQAMKEHMATCTGLSILLTDAYRSVGIPSRLAGTAMWTNYKGNHTWSEVWINGEWNFIEYYVDTLNQSWFVADAGKADPDNMLHWIYAVSYKPTGLPYYAAVDAPYIYAKVDTTGLPHDIRTRFARMKERAADLKPYIWGHNVTARYINIYKESLQNSQLKENECMVNITVFENTDTSKSESRLKCRVDVLKDEAPINFGYSPRKTDDMNQFLKLKLEKNTSYKLTVTNPGRNINQSFNLKTGVDESQDVSIVLN